MRRFHNQQTDTGSSTRAASHFRCAASATVLALLCSSATWAVPAKPGVMTFDNAGRSIEVRLIGDENFHYYVTTDGYMLLRGSDGVFRYAIPDGRRLRGSPFPAENPRDDALKPRLCSPPSAKTHHSPYSKPTPMPGNA